MKGFYSAILGIVVLAGFAVPALGYEVIEMKNGASLKGLVNFKGSVPADEVIVIDKDVAQCGKEQKAGKFVVNDSGVKNAVVWLEGVEKGKAIPNLAVRVSINRCAAEPLVGIGFVGGNYEFVNQDDILHTIQLKLGLAYQKEASGRPLKDGATIYNIALPLKGVPITKPIKKYHSYTEDTGLIQIKSNAHTWIRGYIFIFDQPYAAVTDEKGAFIIDNIPPGEYVMKTWHEGFGMQAKKIKIAPGERMEASIELGI